MKWFGKAKERPQAEEQRKAAEKRRQEDAMRQLYPGGKPFQRFLDDDEMLAMLRLEDAPAWCAFFTDLLRRRGVAVWMETAEARTADELTRLAGRQQELIAAANALHEMARAAEMKG